MKSKFVIYSEVIFVFFFLFKKIHFHTNFTKHNSDSDEKSTQYGCVYAYRLTSNFENKLIYIYTCFKSL